MMVLAILLEIHLSQFPSNLPVRHALNVVTPGNNSPLGTAVYLYNILSRGDLTEVSISIDGNFVARYSNRPNPSTQFLYHVPVFAASNLAFGEHSVEMSADGSDQTLVLFDYALYTCVINSSFSTR